MQSVKLLSALTLILYAAVFDLNNNLIEESQPPMTCKHVSYPPSIHHWRNLICERMYTSIRLKVLVSKETEQPP